MWKRLKRQGCHVNVKKIERLYYQVMELRSVMPVNTLSKMLNFEH